MDGLADSVTGLRTSAAYLAKIAGDGRHVYLNGELVTDVTTHPALRGAAKSIAHLYDIAADPAERERMTFPSPATGRPVLRCYHIPKTIQDLVDRRAMMARWADCTFGHMGRTPDHVASFLAGFAAKPSLWERLAGPRFTENMLRWLAKARDEHAYISYAIVPPQIDRSKASHAQADPFLHAGVVRETDAGIIIRGAQQLATGSPFSDYVYVSCIHPLQPGDEAYAFGVLIPVNAKGFKIYARRSYADGAPSEFDYPLATRFDEMDALVVMDDVLVPWEDVLFHNNIQLCREQWFTTPAHALGNHQAQIRYATKLRFLMGVTHRLCEITGSVSLPPVRIMLGEMAAYAAIVENMVYAQETQASWDDENVILHLPRGTLRRDGPAGGHPPEVAQHGPRTRWRRLDHAAVLN